MMPITITSNPTKCEGYDEISTSVVHEQCMILDHPLVQTHPEQEYYIIVRCRAPGKIHQSSPYLLLICGGGTDFFKNNAARTPAVVPHVSSIVCSDSADQHKPSSYSGEPLPPPPAASSLESSSTRWQALLLMPRRFQTCSSRSGCTL